jgi:hypothetical protein
VSGKLLEILIGLRHTSPESDVEIYFDGAGEGILSGESAIHVSKDYA